MQGLDHMKKHEKHLKHYTRPDETETPVLVYIAGMALALAICGVGIYTGLESYRRLADTVPTEGVVVALRQSGLKGGSKPVVEYMVRNDRYTCSGEVASSPSPYSLGERVVVRYKRDDPKSGSIDSFFEQWCFPSLFVVAGLVCAVPTVWGLLHRGR
jgi:uncharacterized protein DUF3592